MTSLAAGLLASWLAWGNMSAPVAAVTSQYEVLAASEEWIVLRENVPATAADVDACRYKGLDPSLHVGVKVHFVRLSAEAKRGRLMPLALAEDALTVYETRRPAEGCTSEAEAEATWQNVVAHARSLDVQWPSVAPAPTVLGAAVSATTCELLSGAGATPPCRRVYRQRVGGTPIQIGVSLTAVPEAPDQRVCQFVGHRAVAAVQVAGKHFGGMGSTVPGGIVDHYDCREQRFEPLRLYDMGHLAVVIGGFGRAALTNRTDRPFVLVFSSRPPA